MLTDDVSQEPFW